MLRIWGRPNSICTQRVLWTCVEAGLDYELTLASGTMGAAGHVSAGHSPYGLVDTPAYRAMNPNGTVPTIDDDGFVLWDSNAIVGYLAARHAPALYRDDFRVLARACQWMSWTNEHLEPALHVLVMQLVRLAPRQRDTTLATGAGRDIEGALRRLDAHLATQPYVAGEHFTVGDIPTGAAAHRWTLLATQRAELPAIEAWLGRLGAREGFQRHVAPRHLHLA